MVVFTALFTGLCGFKKKTRSPETIETTNDSFPLETIEKEQTKDDLRYKETNNLENKETIDRDANESDDVNPELPLPPARKEALRGTYSCNNMMLKRSMSTRKKLSSSLSIKMPRSLSMVLKHDGEEDKSEKKKKLKAENSILVRPIILGGKCRVLDDDVEGDEDIHSQRMSTKNIIYYPRSLSSISISRCNWKIDTNVLPTKETSEDSMRKEGK